MSGGHFNYMDSSLKIEIFGFTDKVHNVFGDRELSELTWDLLNLLHDYDWFVSGDTGEESWRKAKKEFKEKWFNNREAQIHRIINEAINSLRQELYDTFQVEVNEKD